MAVLRSPFGINILSLEFPKVLYTSLLACVRSGLIAIYNTVP